ncbi:hypothetical protein SLT67_12355 [Paenibacillus illinoisensis]|uniref:hypothetical protein n=1 Tax=Paenibacillus illinoisensis TaxID=59845 RepID=UPI003CE7E0CC
MESKLTDVEILNLVIKGEVVGCPFCGEILVYQTVEQGLPPAVICPKGDYRLKINITSGNLLDRLGLNSKEK